MALCLYDIMTIGLYDSILHALYSIFYILYSILYIQYYIIYTLYSILYTLYSTLYTPYSILYILYSMGGTTKPIKAEGVFPHCVFFGKCASMFLKLCFMCFLGKVSVGFLEIVFSCLLFLLALIPKI